MWRTAAPDYPHSTASILLLPVVSSSAWIRPRSGAMVRTPTMNSPSDKNEKPMKREEPQSETLDRLREEITILRIEGKFFCFDKHEAKRRGDVIRSVLKDADGTPRPISIDVHPRYGQPSILAYKVVQAIFLKLTQLGEPYPNVVAFTQSLPETLT